MLLTQASTPIIGQIAILLGYIMDLIYRGLSAVGIENIGLCIIIFTFLIRMCLLPLTIRQQKFTKVNQAMQPEINKIQKKYRNRKDTASQQKMQQEIQDVYDKYGTNPTGGCAQLLIQFPIFLALYQVIRNIPAYIPNVKASYMQIVNAISTQSGYIKTVKTIGEALDSSYAASYVKNLTSGATANQIIDVLGYFTKSDWTKLSEAIPSASSVINTYSAKIINMNDFILGINVSNRPWQGITPNIYWILPVVAALFQWLSMRTMQTPDGDDNPAAGMTKGMTWTMPLMSLYFCMIMPAGLGIYWVTSAFFQFVQQILVNRYMEKVDLDELIAKNREKAAKKKAKGKKTLMERITSAGEAAESENQNQAMYHNRTVTEKAHINAKKLSAPDGYEYDEKTKLAARDTSHAGEITKNAYIIANTENDRNGRGGKK